MPESGPENGLTEQQKKWFATIRANLEKNTGKTMEAWVEIAKTAPPGTFRERVRWFKAEHGLMQNNASLVLSELEGGAKLWENPDAHREALWGDPAQAAILHAVEAAATGLQGVVAGQRKGYSAWSRKHQFVALRPLKKGGARLGLAVPPDAAPGLEPPRNEGWSERLKAATTLADAAAVDEGVRALILRAWEAS